jgi:hypothetical protein
VKAAKDWLLVGGVAALVIAGVVGGPLLDVYLHELLAGWLGLR